MTSDLQGDLKKVLHTTDHPIISMACSADATKIAFVELTPQGSALVVIDRKTKNKKTIVNQYYVSSPVFSEDGQTIYYIAAPYGTTHIYRHDLSLEKQRG